LGQESFRLPLFLLSIVLFLLLNLGAEVVIGGSSREPVGVLALSEHLVDGCFFPDFKIKFIIDLRLSTVGLRCLVVSMCDEIFLWVLLRHACGRTDERFA